jgi:hypothetical protein
MGEQDLSRAWAALGERIDSAIARREEAEFLTRFALLLATEIESADLYISLADEALAGRRTGIGRGPR